MKKFFFTLISLAFLSAGAQTVDEVIQKYTTNMGGLDAFNKIKTLKITATFSAQGNDLPMTIQIINGKATRTDLDLGGQQMVRSYKEGKAWTVNPLSGSDKPREATATELNDFKAQSMIASPLMDYKARGHQVELLGQVDVEGIKTHKIKLTNKDDGKATLYYINASDYTLLKSESDREMQGQTKTVEVWFSDLKEFGGVKFFMTRMQKMDGQVFQTTTWTNVEVNVTIDEKIFDMPK